MIDFNNIENFELNYIEDITNILGEHMKYSLMSSVQRNFINGIIRKTKPKKILEVGVSAGVNSAIILNAIKDIDNSMLYSIDILEKWHADNNKLSGFVVDEKVQYLTNKWKIYRGNIAAKFMEEIGNNIELCILDAAHVNPGEFLDFLIVLPYLSKNAIVIIHDIQLHNTYPQYDSTCGTLFSCIKGKKFYPENDGSYNDIFGFPNIGAVMIDDNIMNYTEDIFFLLTLKWKYLPSQEDNEYILNHLKKHYSKNSVEIYTKINQYTHNLFNNKIINDEKINVNNSMINKISWWIPVKKWRENFRNKFSKP